MIEWLLLADVAKVDRTAATLEQAATLPYVGLEHIEARSGIFADGYLPVPGDVKATKFRFSDEHVLYGKLRPYLNKRLCPSFTGVCSTEILPILPKDGRLDRYYLFHYFGTQKFVEWASDNVSGANLPRLSPSLLAEALIPYRPFQEQRYIAQRLERADRLRRLRRHALTISDEYLQNVFLEMFGDPGTNPKGWAREELGELIQRFEGGTNFPPVADSAPASEYRVLKISAVTWGNFDASESKPIAVETRIKPEIIVRKGDLLFSRANTSELVGSVAMVTVSPAPVVLPDKIWRIVFGPESKLLPHYTMSYLRTSYARQQISDLATGSSGSMKNISMAKAKSLVFNLPPSDLQARYAEIVGRHERLRRMQIEALRQADQLYETLLEEAFGA